MQPGASTKSHLGRFVPCVLALFILIHPALAAPGQPGTERDDPVDGSRPAVTLINPFDSGRDRRLMQSYIQSTLKDSQLPEINTWEQEVFFLFRLFDYDRSGLLDGLEMMQLISDYNSHHTPGAQANEQVVSMVDVLLQSQDSNQDGLLAPSELLSPPVLHSQDTSKKDEPLQEQKETLPSTDEEQPGAQEHNEEKLQPHVEEQTQEEAKITKEEMQQEAGEQHGQEIPEVPAAEQEQDREVPVHLGQPEI